MKAKATIYGKGNKGGMGGAMKSSKADGAALKKGLVMQKTSMPMEASDNESAEHMLEAKTGGLPKGSAMSSSMHKIPENLLKHQSHLHEASGFMSKK